MKKLVPGGGTCFSETQRHLWGGWGRGCGARVPGRGIGLVGRALNALPQTLGFLPESLDKQEK